VRGVAARLGARRGWWRWLAAALAALGVVLAATRYAVTLVALERLVAMLG
jgi:drug/metabolite transporter (DMT)-like permease